MKLRSLVIVPSLLAVMLAGCAGTDELTVATYKPTGEGGNGAAFAGTLTRSESGCLTIASGDSSVVPVFPDDAIAVDGEAILYRSQTYSLGDTIRLGGGFVNSQDLPEECTEETDTFIVSANP